MMHSCHCLCLNVALDNNYATAESIVLLFNLCGTVWKNRLTQLCFSYSDEYRDEELISSLLYSRFPKAQD